MDQNLYLTEKLKEFYLEDFQKLLSYNISDFWDIDEGIKESLQSINSNPNIQTLYSKKLTLNEGSISLDTKSYLVMTFTQSIESKLLTVLEEIKSSLMSRSSVLNINELEPCDNANYNRESRIQLGCVTNPDYFRIKHVRISIDSNVLSDHDLFWSELTSKLQLLTK